MPSSMRFHSANLGGVNSGGHSSSAAAAAKKGRRERAADWTLASRTRGKINEIIIINLKINGSILATVLTF